jgi:hypothetical protein
MVNDESYRAKQFDLSGLNGSSGRTLEMHFKLYEGYVSNTSTSRRSSPTSTGPPAKSDSVAARRRAARPRKHMVEAERKSESRRVRLGRD